MYVCMYPSRLGIQLFRALHARKRSIKCASVTLRNVTAVPAIEVVSYPAAPPHGKGRLVTIETFLGPARASDYIIITCSGRRAYHEYSTWSFPDPAKTA